MRRVLLFVGVPLVFLLAGCGSPSDSTATVAADATTTTPTSPPSTTPPRPVTSMPAKNPGAGAKKTPGTAPKGNAGSGGSTATVPSAPDLKDFCGTAKTLKITSLDSFAQFDAKGSGKLVLGFAHMAKVAPADIGAAVTDMQPLVIELNKKVKAGDVHDLASYKAWLAAADADSVKKWIAAQQLLVPYVEKNCA